MKIERERNEKKKEKKMSLKLPLNPTFVLTIQDMFPRPPFEGKHIINTFFYSSLITPQNVAAVFSQNTIPFYLVRHFANLFYLSESQFILTH